MIFQVSSNFRGRIWKLPNGYWRACNLAGSQCTFRMHNEALKFAQKEMMMEQGHKELFNARKYVSSIKNAAKRKYAEQYLLYRMGNFEKEPDRPAELSYMGAQAVRLELNSLLR